MQTYLVDAPYDGPHGGVPWPVHGPPVVGGSPGGRVDVDEVGLVAHGVGLDEVRHVGLVQHPDSRHHGVVGDADAADAVVAGARDLAGAAGAVAM